MNDDDDDEMKMVDLGMLGKSKSRMERDMDDMKEEELAE